MKPMKKKNTKNVKPKNAAGIKPTEKIDNYFDSAPKPFVIEKIGDAETTKIFFVQTLTELLDGGSTKSNTEHNSVDRDVGEFTDGASVSEEQIKALDKSKTVEQCAGCREREDQLKNWEEKYKSLQKTYLTQSHHFSELQIKHNVLLSTRANQTLTNDIATNDSKKDIFSPTELKILQNMSLNKNKDSTFVHQCLEYLYKDNLAIFSCKTLKGVPESVKFDANGNEIHCPKKDPFTPEKVSRIRELFVDRICKCSTDSASFEARVKESNFNKIFASCVKNISNKNN